MPGLRRRTGVMLTVPLFHVYRGAGSGGEFPVTRLALAPPSLLAIVRTAEDDESVTASAATLQVVLCGGAALSPGLIRRFSHKFPHICVLQGYGLTETTAGFAVPFGVEESRRIGSILDSEGWLRTGDVCLIDKDGFLFMVDRLKEIISTMATGGPSFKRTPGIDEAAVVGYADDQAGELPVAFVVQHSGSKVHEAQIKDFVAKQEIAL
ncbi:hypothetical protein ZWY2020_020601 [Hordeum vulgare]|nr:hypothetical protein ZWY2020_020601 [Hordeum vulgare]